MSASSIFSQLDPNLIATTEQINKPLIAIVPNNSKHFLYNISADMVILLDVIPKESNANTNIKNLYFTIIQHTGYFLIAPCISERNFYAVIPKMNTPSESNASKNNLLEIIYQERIDILQWMFQKQKDIKTIVKLYNRQEHLSLSTQTIQNIVFGSKNSIILNNLLNNRLTLDDLKARIIHQTHAESIKVFNTDILTKIHLNLPNLEPIIIEPSIVSDNLLSEKRSQKKPRKRVYAHDSKIMVFIPTKPFKLYYIDPMYTLKLKLSEKSIVKFTITQDAIFFAIDIPYFLRKINSNERNFLYNYHNRYMENFANILQACNHDLEKVIAAYSANNLSTNKIAFTKLQSILKNNKSILGSKVIQQFADEAKYLHTDNSMVSKIYIFDAQTNKISMTELNSLPILIQHDDNADQIFDDTKISLIFSDIHSTNNDFESFMQSYLTKENTSNNLNEPIIKSVLDFDEDGDEDEDRNEDQRKDEYLTSSSSAPPAKIRKTD